VELEASPAEKVEDLRHVRRGRQSKKRSSIGIQVMTQAAIAPMANR